MGSVAHIIRRRRSRKARRQAAQAKSSRWTTLVLGIVFLIVVVPAGVTLGGAAWLYADAVRALPTPDESQSLGPAVGPTQLYDRTGTTLLFTAADLNDTSRWVSLEQLPSYVLQTTLLMEDPDFLSATGFDGLSTLSKMWRNILYGPLSPDATLTGRLVRNVIAPLPDVPSADHISREIAMVAELERRYTPQQILEWHLNTNYYGGAAYGIQAAAQIYIGKNAVDLTLDEAAMLAAIPLAPQYNPFDNEPAARGRQLDVLKAMRAAGSITSDQFDAAAATVTPIQITGGGGGQIAPEFSAYARRQAEDILKEQGRNGTQLVSRGGLRIVTSLDLDLYYQSQCAIDTHLARLNGESPPDDAGDGQPCQAALYLPPDTESLADNAPDQARLVLIDVATGEIRSMVGAGTAVDAQPGVTLFPFVYLTGFMRSQNDTPAKMVLDIPRTFPGAQEGLIYTPNNPDGRFRGVLNLRDAMSAWLLPPAAQIARERGLDEVLRFAHRIGVNSLGEDGYYDLSLLERGGAVSVLDMTYAYSVFASQGDMRGVPIRAVGQGYRQRNPVAVLRIEGADGEVLWEYTDEQVAANQVGIFPHAAGYLVSDILSDTDKRRSLLGDTSILEMPREAAVVNGTAGNDNNSWTIGYTPQLVAGVHVERDDSGAMALDALGLDGAAPIWRAVMQYAHDRDALPPVGWSRPDEILSIGVCEKSGLLPNAVCPVRNEIFIAGRAPTQTDTYWQSVEVNSQTLQLATANTSPQLRVSSLFFIPPPEALDWWVANNQPLPPEEYDNISRPNLLSTVQLLQPAQFAYIGGVVDVRGSLEPTDMQYFQLSYGQGPNPTEWFQVGERQTEFRPGSTLGTWDTTNLADGLYILRLTLQHLDNTAENGTVQVTVDNTPPSITLNAGEPGQSFSLPGDQTIPLTADVQDTYTVSRVEFYQDGQFLGTDTEYPFGFNWSITQTGATSFSAVAFDTVGNQASSAVTVEIRRGG